jgi:hypothetical protein
VNGYSLVLIPLISLTAMTFTKLQLLTKEMKV